MSVTPPTDQPRRSRRTAWPPYAIGALLVVALLGVVAWNVQLPYMAFSAGPVHDASNTIVAEEVEVHPANGELLVLTVAAQGVNPFEGLIAGFDSTVDLVRRDAVRRPDETDEDYRNRVLQQMEDSNHRSILVAMEYLGYGMVPVEVVINDFVEDSQAATVLELGDTITGINDVAVTRIEDVRAALEGLSPGDTILVTVDRQGVVATVEVELAEREDEPGEPLIGVLLGELTEPPFPIRIESGDIGGPSAGMMHALAIIDTLTEGSLTKGNVIAGTGTVTDEGIVGNVGSIRQKVVAAEAAGASHILVPEGNYQLALTADRREIEIVPVATIHDAIEFLESLDPA